MAKDSFSLIFTNSDTSAQEIWYVRLGALLQFIEEKIMYYSKIGEVSTPILKFDYNIESNLMYIESNLQTSIDPSICVVNRNVRGIDFIQCNVARYKGELFDSSLFPNLDTTYGQIMNIYVSMSWILTKLDELKEASTNKVVLIDFLNTILTNINGALGGISKLEATINETTNTVIIRDANPLPYLDEVIKTLKNKGYDVSSQYADFDLYGYNDKTNSASFIKDFSFTTEITPELSTMITVGATANSEVVGENSTAFSKFNAGLKDRFKETLTQGDPNPSTVTDIVSNWGFEAPELEGSRNAAKEQRAADIQYKALLGKFAKTLSEYQRYLERLHVGQFTSNEAETYKDALTNILTYQRQSFQAALNKAYAEKGLPAPNLFAPSTGFIPFNLSLTMDGLSGMKIYSKFFIDTRFLPANYPDNAEFLIKSITHTIENNKWNTQLESIVISKGKETYNKKSNKNSDSAPTSTPIGELAFSYSILNEYARSSTPILKLAVKTQSNFVFDKLKTPKGLGEVTGYCAGYTYNIAYKIKEFVDKYITNPSTSPSPISFSYQPSGDANSDSHRAKIKNLGIYDEYYLGTYSAATLKKLSFSNLKWNFGDIINYYAPGFSPPSNMHSQIYTGDIYTIGMNSAGIKNSSPNSGWTTSTKTNYGGKFIYKASDTLFKVYIYKIKPEYLK
jgi:hypothetical protein